MLCQALCNFRFITKIQDLTYQATYKSDDSASDTHAHMLGLDDQKELGVELQRHDPGQRLN